MPIFGQSAIGTLAAPASSVGLVSARFEYTAGTLAMTSGTTYTVPYAVTDWNDIPGLTLNGDGSLTFGASAQGKYLISAFGQLTAASIPLNLILVPTNKDGLDTVSEQDSAASTGNASLPQAATVEGMHQFFTGDTLKVAAIAFAGATLAKASVQVVRVGKPGTPTATSCTLSVGSAISNSVTWHEPTNAFGNITTGNSPSLTIGWLHDDNGNSPGARAMQNLSGPFNTFFRTVDHYTPDIGGDVSRATYSLGWTNAKGYLSTSSTYTPGYANDGAGIGLLVNIRSSSTAGPVQLAWAGGTTGATFSTTPTTGNLILMFCHAEPFQYGSISPGGSGWALLGTANIYGYSLSSTAGYAIIGIYARCMNTGDGSTYFFNKSGGYSTGCSVVLAEWAP